MVQYNIALIGFGGVNRALAQLVAERNDLWQSELGFRLNIVAVTDLNLGSVISQNGIDPRTLVETKFEKGALPAFPADRPRLTMRRSSGRPPPESSLKPPSPILKMANRPFPTAAGRSRAANMS